MKLLRPLAILVLLVTSMIVVRSVNAETGSTPPIKVQALNDYLLYFFDGRRPPSAIPRTGTGWTMPP